MTAPAATTELADDLWFMSHDSVTGSSLLHPRTVGLGLAAGLVAEQMLTGWFAIEMHDGHHILTAVDLREISFGSLLDQPDRPKPKLVPLGRGLWNSIIREPKRLPVRQVITMLAPTAEKQVVGRLTETNLLRAGRSGAAELLSWNTAGAPGARLWALLHYDAYKDISSFTLQDVVLVALVGAIGLNGALLSGHDDRHEHASDYYDHLLATLGSHYPMFSALAAHTGAAIASATAAR